MEVAHGITILHGQEAWASFAAAVGIALLLVLATVAVVQVRRREDR